MAEGRVPNFNDITRDIVALNQWPDRQVVPEIKPGEEPWSVDIDLNVKDKRPLHGSLEINNRYSPGTTSLRINGGISYNNLWQAGHAAGVNFQIAPERLKDAKVLSAYYLARLRSTDKVSFLFSGNKQDSDVSTLGGAAVAGRGEILGIRALFSLPQEEGFFQSLSFGVDYKHLRENLLLGGELIKTPVSYYPWNLSYGAVWSGKSYTTEANAALNFHLRGMGSAERDFDAKRYKSGGGFFYLRGDLSHTRELNHGYQLFAKVQGQIAGQPLINSEQFAAGGLSTVRGYAESAAPGDNAVAATLELRSPSLIRTTDTKANDWRAYAFVDAGAVSLTDALPGQEDHFELLGAGIGTRFRLRNHFNGSVDAAFPLLRVTGEDGLFVTFRLWTDF
jgi:hemolysin activation/secretion protein